MSAPLGRMRRSYELNGLDAADLAPTWPEQFAAWLADAVAAEVAEPNAMVLATASAAGVPSARTVLLKDVDERGFAFFTNLRSRKGREPRPTRAPRSCSPGSTCSARSSWPGPSSPCPRPSPTPTSRRGRGGRGSGRCQPTGLCHRLPRRAAGRPRRCGSPPPRAGGDTAARELGRAARRPGDRRVLAGPARSPARPARLPPHGGGGLGRRAPGALTAPGPFRAARRVGPRSGDALGPGCRRATRSGRRGRARTAARR